MRLCSCWSEEYQRLVIPKISLDTGSFNQGSTVFWTWTMSLTYCLIYCRTSIFSHSGLVWQVITKPLKKVLGKQNMKSVQPASVRKRNVISSKRIYILSLYSLGRILQQLFSFLLTNLYKICAFHGTCDRIGVARATDSLTFDRIHSTW